MEDRGLVSTNRGIPVTTPEKSPSSPAVPILSYAELNANPHEVYQAFRSQYPYLRREDGAYIILRAKDVQAFLSDPRTRQVETEALAARGISSGPIMEFVSNSMLFSNGDAHRRRRHPLTKSFAFRLMGDLRPKIRTLAEELLSENISAGKMKLRDDYAALIPAITIAGVLGIPKADVPLFTSMAYQVSRVLTTSWTPEDVPGMEAATRDLRDYAANLIAERRRLPRNDFLSEYVAKVDEDAEMSAIEAVMQIVSVILGGSDTTRAAIVIQTSLLIERPDIWQALCADPELTAPAVAEALRYEPSVGSIPRLSLEEIVLDGYAIPRGSFMVLSTLSSMRDPDLFPNPNEFDLLRDRPKWHPVFGGGEHRCLGEALAKIEMEEALSALTRSQLKFKLQSGPLRIHGHAGIRSVDELEVQWM